MTAGILVCCMPSTAVVLGHLKEPVFSFLAKSRKGFSSFFTSFPITHHENLDSTSNLRPHYSDSNPQDKGQEQYEMQKPWSGPEDVWREMRPEPDTTAVNSFGDARVRKTTKVEVTRESDPLLARLVQSQVMAQGNRP